jgi:hypothetical protein
MEYYYVNNDTTYNPGYHHEVHTEKHSNELMIKDKTYLGYYSNLTKAKNFYSKADGCAICCPLCHRG